jgi:hypothetical protein
MVGFPFRRCARGKAMQRVDGYYLYQTGLSIHPLEGMKGEDSYSTWLLPLLVANGALSGFVNNSIFKLKTSHATGNQLLEVIKVLIADTAREKPIDFYEAYSLTSALAEFEHVLNAEMSLSNLYLVTKKRGYDTDDLIHSGLALFPDDLAIKAPEAIYDILQGTRCLAFELSTASGFHLHRANEAILRRYYDVVSSGAPRPNGRNMGDYLAVLRENKWGDDVVLSSLRDLKDLHRNPLIHPEHSIESVDDAIALMNSIHACINRMLKVLPLPPPPPELPEKANL